MRFFLDTEFIEDGRTIDLISIGIVADDGREYYAESNECDLTRASPWVVDNVLPHLKGPSKSRHRIRGDVWDFMGDKPEVWAYYGAYDWVALCQLFGTMMALPTGWPMYVLDLKQAADFLIGDRKLRDGTPERLLPKTGTQHNALDDARWTKEAWHNLMQRGHP